MGRSKSIEFDGDGLAYPRSRCKSDIMSFVGRNHETQPWVSDNGLRVEKRSSAGFWLTWDVDPNGNIPSAAPSATTSGEDCSAQGADAVDHVGATDGLNGPWYEVQQRKAADTEWATIYKGYRKRIEVKDLQSDTTFYFRMKRNGQQIWGTEIIAATDSAPPYADDIHQAVKSNAEDMVLRIIASTKGAQLKRMLVSCNELGQTPLMQACQAGNYVMVNTLIKAGAWVHATSHKNRQTALMHACTGGNVRVVELLDDCDADWTKRDVSGSTAFHHAINANQLGPVKYIVNRFGAEGVIEEKDGFGWSPLLRAIIVNCSPEMIKYLLEKGANPNATDRINTKSCLMVAVVDRKREHVKLLLDHNADYKYQNTLGKTAMSVCMDEKIADMISTKIFNDSEKRKRMSKRELRKIIPAPPPFSMSDIPLEDAVNRTARVHQSSGPSTSMLSTGGSGRYTLPAPTSSLFSSNNVLGAPSALRAAAANARAVRNSTAAGHSSSKKR